MSDVPEGRMRLIDEIASIGGAQHGREELARRSGGKSPSVMVLEDDVELLSILSRSLMAAGYSVTASQLAEHAMIILETATQMDLIIVDVVLPGMDGVAFLAQAKERRPGLPFIVMTGSDNADRLKRLPGGIAVLLKPFRRQQLLELVGATLASAQTANP